MTSKRSTYLTVPSLDILHIVVNTPQPWLIYGPTPGPLYLSFPSCFSYVCSPCVLFLVCVLNRWTTRITLKEFYLLPTFILCVDIFIHPRMANESRFLEIQKFLGSGTKL